MNERRSGADRQPLIIGVAVLASAVAFLGIIGIAMSAGTYMTRAVWSLAWPLAGLPILLAVRSSSTATRRPRTPDNRTFAERYALLILGLLFGAVTLYSFFGPREAGAGGAFYGFTLLFLFGWCVRR